MAIYEKRFMRVREYSAAGWLRGWFAVAALSVGLAGPAYGSPESNLLLDSNRFPIAVWLQNPSNASRYWQAGINLYVGLWKGPTDEQLSELKAAGMPVVCEQTAKGLAHKGDPIIVGWMHGDEPDNAQPVTDPVTGKPGYGPFIPPERIVEDYDRIKKADPSRPVVLNLGQGVANDQWVGRGNGAKLSDYETYVKGGDIVSFDVYPVSGLDDPEKLWYVAKGVGRLMGWTDGKRRVWSCIECTRIDGKNRASPLQVKAEVWMAITKGATGLIYFVHQFQPSFNEHALLDDPEMLPAVTALNRQIQDLARVLNSPTIKDGATVLSTGSEPQIGMICKRHGGAKYLFAVGMRNAAAHATFEVNGLKAVAVAEVLGENRTVKVKNGRFEDHFGPYEVHLYRLK